MYKKILIPLDHSPADQTILEHIYPLVQMMNSEIVLVHVADGYVARFQEKLNLADSQEIKEDRLYLENQKKELTLRGVSVKTYLVGGEPADQILAIAEQENCDLIAMSTHGHRFFKDILLGSVAENIRHRTDIPILMIRAVK